jgi:hypothetical protein
VEWKELAVKGADYYSDEINNKNRTGIIPLGIMPVHCLKHGIQPPFVLYYGFVVLSSPHQQEIILKGKHQWRAMIFIGI